MSIMLHTLALVLIFKSPPTSTEEFGVKPHPSVLSSQTTTGKKKKKKGWGAGQEKEKKNSSLVTKIIPS